jgi:ketosteroid isomerase-like protein
MSQENVKLVHRAFDAFNRRDLDATLALMDDDVEGVPRIAAIEGSYHGHEGMRRWWKNLLDTFPDFTVKVGESRDIGDMTVAAVHLRGQGAGGDTPTEATIWHVARWRLGKCVWWRTFSTRPEALEAVGLSE